MQHFIYSIFNEKKIVHTDEYNELLKTAEWFKTPSEAKQAFEDAKMKEKKKSKPKKAKEVEDGHISQQCD